jgi:hypothetical protein
MGHVDGKEIVVVDDLAQREQSAPCQTPWCDTTALNAASARRASSRAFSSLIRAM